MDTAVGKDRFWASRGKPEFFDADMYMFHITGFQPGRGVLTEPVQAAHGNGLALGGLPGVEQVELDFPHDAGDAGLVWFPGGEVAGFL